MAELTNRDELESDFAKKFGKAARRHMFEFRELLGNPPDEANVPLEFYEMCRRENERDLYPILLLIFSASARQHGWDGIDMRMTAIGYAEKRAEEIAQNWVDSTRQRFEDKVEQWNKQNTPKPATGIQGHLDEHRTITPGSVTIPGEMTRDDLDSILDEIYGPKRIFQWVEDETTRARHEGAESAIDATVGLSEEDVWRTEDDKSVCPTCKPLDRTPRSYWGRFFPDGPPTPHSRCRCFVSYANSPAELAETV